MCAIILFQWGVAFADLPLICQDTEWYTVHMWDTALFNDAKTHVKTALQYD